MKTLKISNLEPLPYAAEEAMNRLRVNLGFCGDRFKKIIITSSTPNEGKSFVSMNLWRLLAEAGHNVVLVDADIRKSVIRSRYQISLDEKHNKDSGEDERMLGIAHYLSGQAQINDVIYKTNMKGYLVPTSYTVSNPAILLQSPRFSKLLNELTNAFDYVLVDTPPLTNVSDGNLIASQCDGGLLVVRSGVTPRNLIASSISQFERSGCELMGVVLNRVEAKNNPYYYKYTKYGYYNSYYYGESKEHKDNP